MLAMNDCPFILRRAVSQDAVILSRIARAAYAPYVRLIGREPAPMVADYAAHIADDICFVAIAGEQVIGFAVLIKKADGWWLETIATDPAHQGQGAGAALMACCEQFLADAGAAICQLYTNEVMSAPYGWYIRLGFDENYRAQQDGFARIFMRKQLG